MSIELFSLLMLISGMWMALISYYIDFDFLRIEKLKHVLSNIKENTLIMVSVAFIGIVVSIITKVFVIAPVSVSFSNTITRHIVKSKKNKNARSKNAAVDTID